MLYLVYVYHYSVNIPFSDDWTVLPYVHLAVQGHLTLHDLWTQWGDTRLFMPRLIFVAFGLYDHFNVKAIIVFSALLMVASYAVLLLMIRRTVASVLAVGIAWFSLADVGNALWSFQLPWYLVTFSFVVAIYCLLAQHRTVFLVLGIAAAVIGSLSIVQGLVIWPVGLICLVWMQRSRYALAAWSAVAVITTAFYLHGFNTHNVECPTSPQCATSYAFTHPVLLAKYLALLIGNIFPISLYAIHYGWSELLGFAIALVAVCVVVQSVRHRSDPVPVVLIAFGVLFDLLISVGRIGEGMADALAGRYTMPNLILLTGLVVYACEHLPAVSTRSVVLGLCLVSQVVVATTFGVDAGRLNHEGHESDARVVVNLRHIPTKEWACVLSIDVFPPRSPTAAMTAFVTGTRSQMVRGHLSVFQPKLRAHYRSEGLPVLPKVCRDG